MIQFGIDFKNNGKVIESFICETEEIQTALMGTWECGESSPHFPDSAMFACATTQVVLSTSEKEAMHDEIGSMVKSYFWTA